MTLTAESSIADIAARFNQLSGTDTDVKTLAKRGKAKLLAKIQELEAAAAEKKGLEAAEAAKAKAASATPKADGKAEPKKGKPAKEKKEKGPVIRHVAEALLLEVVERDEEKRPYGHSYETVLAKIKEQFPGAKTSIACLRWYAVHMRERGERVPNRPRAVAPAAKTEAE